MTFKSRFTTAIATGAVLLNAMAPVALANTNGTSINVSGNGAFSNSSVNVNTNSSTNVNQTNNANITNNVSSNANSGGNNANFNTGGQVVIDTGNATTNTSVSTRVNANIASLENCGGCVGGDLDVKISGNGAFSENDVDVRNNNTVNLTQDNDADIRNDIDAKANTGKNDANFNTGGDTIIRTGNARTNVSVDNQANKNVALIGGGNGGNGASVEISGNGAFSENDVDLRNNSAIVLEQLNDANIRNDIDAKANTGKNDADFNTGGLTAILTGNATTNVDVDNKVNFNWASLDCECVFEDLDVKVAGNGAESENDVDVRLNDALVALQDNDADLDNDVDDEAKTGYNDIGFSTGDVEGDPAILTGNANSNTNVSNEGNVNVLNQGGLDLPGDWEVDTEFDLSELLVWLHLVNLG